MSRGDLTDWKWRIFDPLLPGRGERGPPIKDKRRTVNGTLWVLHAGAPWRDTPKRYGNWNLAFVRFTRWSKLGVWDTAFETRPPTKDCHRFDGRAGTLACSRRKRGNQEKQALGRSRGGFSTKIHLRTNAKGNPLAFEVTGGEAHEVKGSHAGAHLVSADPLGHGCPSDA